MVRRLLGLGVVVSIIAVSCAGGGGSGGALVVAGQGGVGAEAGVSDSEAGTGGEAAPAGGSGGSVPVEGGAGGGSDAAAAGEGGLAGGGGQQEGGVSGVGGAVAGAAGADASAGAGGASSTSCGALIENAGCADADPATLDYESGEFQSCVHFRDPKDGWVRYDAAGGFAYDLRSGLAWVQRATPVGNRAQISAFCAGLELAGSSNWRLPTIDEARVFSAGCAPTEVDGTCELSAPSCLTQDCGTGPLCVSCKAHEGPYGASQDYCPSDAPFCISIATSSSCSDCGMDADWRNSPINGNFFAASGATFTFPVCVAEDVARAAPCAP